MEGVDLVIHAAAMKHVDIAEYNPTEEEKNIAISLFFLSKIISQIVFAEFMQGILFNKIVRSQWNSNEQ